LNTQAHSEQTQPLKSCRSTHTILRRFTSIAHRRI
jgi:hypothetical protein